MITNKALIELVRSTGLSMDEAWTGFAKLAWPQNLREIEIGHLYDREPWGPEQVHPKRLLAELVDEFDRTR